jgi:hypothetical protein
MDNSHQFYSSIFEKLEDMGAYLNSFYEVSVALVLELDKNSTEKN